MTKFIKPTTLLTFCMLSFNIVAQDYALYKRRPGTSTLFKVDKMVWCKEVSLNMPVQEVNEIISDNTVVLWIQLRGDQNALNIMQKRMSQPAYVKIFRAASYGLTPENLTEDKSELTEEKVNDKSMGEKFKMYQASLSKENFFTIRIWTEPFSFPRKGSYYIKLVDFDNNTINLDNQPLLRIEIK